MQPDRALAEQRGRLALQPGAVRRGHLGHHLPDHGPALGPQRGIEIPKETIDKAIEYVKSCQNGDGGFRYQASQGVRPGRDRRRAWRACTTRGSNKDDAIDRGVKYVVSSALPGTNAVNTSAHYYYGTTTRCRACTWRAGVLGQVGAGGAPGTAQQAGARRIVGRPLGRTGVGTSMALIVCKCQSVFCRSSRNDTHHALFQAFHRRAPDPRGRRPSARTPTRPGGRPRRRRGSRCSRGQGRRNR